MPTPPITRLCSLSSLACVPARNERRPDPMPSTILLDGRPAEAKTTTLVDMTCTGMGLPARQGAGRRGVHLVGEWTELMSAGATYREIGAAYGYSHERI